MNRYIFMFLLLGCCANLYGQVKMKTAAFTFTFEGKKLRGLVDTPRDRRAGAVIILVPGSGKTDIVAGNWFADLRALFVSRGISACVWDKAGCGRSEGEFNYNQPVQNSADEVIAAIQELKRRRVAGADKMMLWGISRAGWICPLVIAKYPAVAGWISVSGTDDKENLGYLLEKNLLIEGRSKAETKKLVNEWQRGIYIARSGGTFEENLAATANLRKDPFYSFINGSKPPTREGYLSWQHKFQTGETRVDEKTGLPVYVPEFGKLLGQVHCPVLAIFGEKDSQVDWRKTLLLYKQTLGSKPGTALSITILPDGNHNMQQCKTGGFREKLPNPGPCKGYYEAITAWLSANGF